MLTIILKLQCNQRKLFWFHKNGPWTKTYGQKNVDVPMGCELVGSGILSKLNGIFDKKNVGLYRDDELDVFRNLLGPEVEKKRKEITVVYL